MDVLFSSQPVHNLDISVNKMEKVVYSSDQILHTL